MGTLFSVSDLIMDFNQNISRDIYLENLLTIFLEGLEVNAGLDKMKYFVNSFLPFDKYGLLQKILANESFLSIGTLLNCLRIFLDERTKYFNFIRVIWDHRILTSILEIILKYCPNIETVDLCS